MIKTAEGCLQTPILYIVSLPIAFVSFLLSFVFGFLRFWLWSVRSYYLNWQNAGFHIYAFFERFMNGKNWQANAYISLKTYVREGDAKRSSKSFLQSTSSVTI
jgi:hypothetical protein